MLDYEWANPSSVMLDESESVNGSDPNRHLHHHNSILDHYSTTQAAFNNLLPPQPHQQQQQSAGSAFAHHFSQAQAHQVHSLFDPSVFASASSYAPTSAHHHHHHSVLTLDPSIPGHHGLVLIPKSEDVCPPADFATRIGLNLGGRTYFSSEDDFMNRLYRRSRPAEHGPINSPRCQAEGCHADLSQAKHYHRRHKVCEFHSKASTVIANGLTQRFCQQCSRLSHTRNYRRTLPPKTLSPCQNDANVLGSATPRPTVGPLSHNLRAFVSVYAPHCSAYNATLLLLKPVSIVLSERTRQRPYGESKGKLSLSTAVVDENACGIETMFVHANDWLVRTCGNPEGISVLKF